MIRDKVYTQVEFLGPILGKTVFDIMLERSDPYNVSYYDQDVKMKHDFLEVTNEKQQINGFNQISSYEKLFSSKVYSSLLAKKTRPDIILEEDKFEKGNIYTNDFSMRRKVIFRPDMPDLKTVFYKGNVEVQIKANVLVSPRGEVKMIEIVNGTGHAEIDELARKYLLKWLFEPAAEVYADDEWLETEITLKTENVYD